MAKVIVYSTTTCPYCHMEKDYLKSKGIDFEDVVLDYNPDRIEEFTHTCNSMAVPCTHIIKDDGSEERVIGFDKQRLDAILGIA